MVEKVKIESEGLPIYKLVEVSTQTAPAIQKPNGEVIFVEQALVDILNKLDAIINHF